MDTILLTACVPSWSVSIDSLVTVGKFVLLFVVPLAFMTAAYVQIVAILWHYQLSGPSTGSQNHSLTGMGSMSSGVGGVGVGAELQMRVRRKAARMLVAVVIMFALFYLPVHVISIVRIMGEMSNTPLNSFLSQLSHLLCYANSAVNPIIYNFMSDKFRREFHTVLFCRAPGRIDEAGPRMRHRTASSRLTLKTQRV